jgi:glyoxylase-like metal-dependent hydrolase (beta-lactamase superfamily II)
MTGIGNNTWLVDGRVPTLIDAGIGRPSHIDRIAERLAGRPLACVLVTHGHGDHASGAPTLRARWPAVDIYKRTEGDESGWLPLADGDRVPAGDGSLTVVHTPGHAPDHVCFWDETAGALFGGDMVLQGTTVMIPAGRGGSMRAYLSSLDRLARLGPRTVYPGHGPVIERPAELIAEYIRHREMREAQILSCLTEGVTAFDEIIARVYPGLPEAIHPAAKQTIQAHVDKLTEEGRLPKRSSSPGVG